MRVRVAEISEIEPLAKIWYDGWRDAHAAIVPAELAQVRTLDSFRQRLRAALPNAWTFGPAGAPVGFYMLKGEELDQLFVAAESRGTGVAAMLIADAEERLRASGVAVAWLACAIGNLRAARFYERCGWHLAGNVINTLETPNGTYRLEVWRYEKCLIQP